MESERKKFSIHKTEASKEVGGKIRTFGRERKLKGGESSKWDYQRKFREGRHQCAKTPKGGRKIITALKKNSKVSI